MCTFNNYTNEQSNPTLSNTRMFNKNHCVKGCVLIKKLENIKHGTLWT